MPSMYIPPTPVYIPLGPNAGEPAIDLRGSTVYIVHGETELWLTLEDVNGDPISQPVTITALGYTPGMNIMEGAVPVAIKSGTLPLMPIESAEGARKAAEAAVLVAQEAQQAAQDIADTVAAGVYTGADAAVEILTPGSDVRAAMDTIYVGEPVPFGRDAARFDQQTSIYNLTPTTAAFLRSRMARALAGWQTSHVACYLDSIVAGAGSGTPERYNSWVGQLGRKFAAETGSVGTGIIPYHDTGGLDERFTISGTVTNNLDWGVFGLGALRLEGRTPSITLAATSFDRITLWVLASNGYGEIFYNGSSGGYFATEVRAPEGGVWTAVADGHPRLLRIDMTVAASGPQTIMLKAGTPSRTTDVIYPIAIETYVANSKTVRFSNIARGQTMMSHAVTDDAVNGYRGMAITLDAFKPDVAILMAGMNDFQQHIPVATFKARVATFIDRQAARGGLTILVTPPRPNFTHIPGDHVLTPPFEDYREALYELADEKTVPLVDIAHRWESYTQAAALGYYADYVHPNIIGQRDIAEAMYKALRF